MSSLQGEIMSRIRRSSAKVRNSRHFMPIVSAIVVALIVGLLQYNRLIVANVKAYVSPGEINPQNIVLDPTNINVGSEPKLIIPKINVEAPIVYDVGSLADAPVQKALEGGVVHYPIPGADSLPGQAGNNVILGHSSNDVFDNGGYKFVFVQLDKLSAGDTFYINHEGKRHTYRVTDKFIINPDEVSRLIIDTNKPMTTLVTCTPPGTALRRLVVTAEQVNPDPNAAAARPALGNTGNQEVLLPGNSESLLERLF
jgi:sortase A